MANKIWIGATDTDWNTAANWSATGVPGVADNVRISPTASTRAIAAFDASGTALGDLIVEAGFAQALGTTGTNAVPTYLQVDPNRFEYAGIGEAYIDISAAAIDVLVTATQLPATGKRGLYLLGSAISDLAVVGGHVGVAFLPHETSTVALARVENIGTSLICGEGTTLTAASVRDGTLTVRCAATTLDVFSGSLVTEEEGAVTTINAYGGQVDLGSSGTITTLNIYSGATVDTTVSAIPRTITTVNIWPGGSFILHPSITLTNAPVWKAAVSIATSSP